MPGVEIRYTQDTLADVAADLERLAENLQPILKESLRAREEVLMEAIKQNWVTMTGGTTGDFVYDSVGLNVTDSKLNPGDSIGTVGVFNLDRVKAKHGKTDKDLNAAQISYWIEFGTSRLKRSTSGLRKAKGREYSEEDLITVQPKPFITNAHLNSLEAQEKAFKLKFNELVDKL